jgi:hypothetical protein
MRIFFPKGEKSFQEFAGTWFGGLATKCGALLSWWNIPPAGRERIRVTRNTLPL